MMKIKENIVRLSAMLLSAVLILLLFMAFYSKNAANQKPKFASLVPTTQVVRAQQNPMDDVSELSPTEQMERQDSLFRVATQDIKQITLKVKAKKLTKRAKKTKFATTENIVNKTKASPSTQEELSEEQETTPIAINQQTTVQSDSVDNIAQTIASSVQVNPISVPTTTHEDTPLNP